MAYYDVVAWMVPVDSGLKKKHIHKILDMLPDEAELIPFEIHESNSSAYGYATTAAVDEENGLETITDLLEPVVEDWTIESADSTFQLDSGRKVYIGCDYRTVIFGG